MTDPAQIPNMDAKQIAELHVIERYLADQLTDEEAHAFEAYVEAHPEVTRDIENISRMKAGLASLRQRGELAPLLVAERPRKPLWFLLAAAAAAVLVAVLVVPRYLGGGSNLPVLAASAQQLLGENEKPLPPPVCWIRAASRRVWKIPAESRPMSSVIGKTKQAAS